MKMDSYVFNHSAVKSKICQETTLRVHSNALAGVYRPECKERSFCSVYTNHQHKNHLGRILLIIKGQKMKNQL